MPMMEQQTEQRGCKSCGSALVGNRQVYCTPTCMKKWRNENRHRRVTASCLHCGKVYKSLATPLGEALGKYCSGTCCAEAFKASGVFKGENNPRWLGGVSTDNMRYRRRQLERWPERDSARKEAARAIRSGALVRQPCEKCGVVDRIEAHHDDYSKPLEIRWLCIDCHRAHHTAERRLERARRAATKAIRKKNTP